MQWLATTVYLADQQAQEAPPLPATPLPTPPLPTHAASVKQMLMADSSASVALSATHAG